jgi:Protein of unknown function (DUF3131)
MVNSDSPYRRRTRRSGRHRRERMLRRLSYALGVCAVAALGMFAWIVYHRVEQDRAASWRRFVASDTAIPVRQPQPLTAEEVRWAAAAWQYFERNTSPRTGLPASVAGERTVHVEDIGSYLLAAIAAHRLEVIEIEAFNDRMSQIFDALARMPLFDEALPNHAYDIQKLSMIGRDGEMDVSGTGWSAVDVSRLLLAFKIICWEYPYFTPQVRDIVGRWQLHLLVENGQMQGAHLSPTGRVVLHREGRLGYEEYAARVMALYNLETHRAGEGRAHIRLTHIDGVELAIDTRPSFPIEGLSLVTSDPYIAHGLELGWNRETLPMAYQVFRVQRQRYATIGEPTAVGAGYLEAPGGRVHCALIVDNRSWRCVDDAGDPRHGASFFSAGAAIGWAALFETDYAAVLRTEAAHALDPRKGWRTGYYVHNGAPVESYTAHTNALILTAIHYVQRGPLLNLLGEVPTDYLTERRETPFE